MNKISAYKTIILFFLLTSTMLRAENTEFIIVYSELPPFFYQDKKGDSVGFFTDIIAQTLEMTGITNYKFEIFPFARMVHSIKKGEVHCQASISNESRRKIAWFPKEPLWTTHWGFFIRKLDVGKLRYESFEDLKSKRIGLIRGYGIPGELKEYVDQNSFVEYVTTEKQNFRKLLYNRVDYIMSEYHTGRNILKELKAEDKIVFLKRKLITSVELYAIFSKKGLGKKGLGKNFIARFSENLVKFKKTDKFKKIIKKYYIDKLNLKNTT